VVPRGGDEHGLLLHRASSEGHGKFVSANLWVRRAIALEIGGFDEGYPAPWREDTDFGCRLVAAGARVSEAPEMVVFHPHYRRPVTSLLRAGRRYDADARLRWRFPEESRRRSPRRGLRKSYAAAALVAVAVAAFVIRAELVAGAVAMAAWALAVAALRTTIAGRGPARWSEWAALVALAPVIAIARTYWVAASNIRYRVWFW
jgi:GT2 family glycosyltransferase